MIVGCPSKEKEEDKVCANSNLITQMLANVDNNKKVEEKDTSNTSYASCKIIDTVSYKYHIGEKIR